METTSGRPSPFVPAVQTPLHRNPPLAPSQELAYREKCIALKRRLTEIETNNDSLRKRLEREKRFQDKMRLNRAILLNYLKEMMEDSGKKPSHQDLEHISSGLRGNGNLAEHLGYDLSETQGPARSDYMMDDSSADSEDDELPEPQEQPLRSKRASTPAKPRDIAVANTATSYSTPANVTNSYSQSSLPNLAPAQSYSPTAPQDPAILTSSFRVSTSIPPVAPPTVAPYLSQPPYSTASSLQQLRSETTEQPFGAPLSNLDHLNPGPPVRPQPPFDQFSVHMKPQLAKENFTTEEMPAQIRAVWNEMSSEDRGLWDAQYKEQMMEYEKAMDDWKRGQRKINSAGFAPVNR